MGVRRTRKLVGAIGLTLCLGVGLAGPASAASITPIKPITPSRPATAPVKPPAPAPKGPRVPFRGWSPSKIQSVAIKNARAARSVRVRGWAAGQDERLSFDVLLGKDVGKLRYTSTKQGTVDLIRIGSAVYLTGDRKFWKFAGEGDISSDQAELLAGKWVKITGNSKDLQDLRRALTIGVWVSELGSFKVTKRVAGKTIGGVKTVGLYEPGARGGILYVSATSKPYPLAAETSDRTAALTYSHWNKPVRITAPRVIATVPL